jgi:hypothetical protein
MESEVRIINQVNLVTFSSVPLNGLKIIFYTAT